jgi:hypothetical protein
MANDADTTPYNLDTARSNIGAGKRHHGEVAYWLAKLSPIQRAWPPPSSLLYALTAPVVTVGPESASPPSRSE